MPYNGSGSFTRVHDWETDKANTIKITASRMDAEFDGMATGLSNAICKDGQSTITADIPFNSQKITGLGSATDAGDALSRQAADAIYAGARVAAGGRLTATSGTAVTTADVSAAGTLYYTPFIHDTIGLYNSSTSRWVLYEFSELSIALSGGTASKPHDVFLDYNGGSPALSLTAWTDDTTRATALTTQDNVHVLTGDTEKRYLGTIYIDASNQVTDSAAKRHIWNKDNRRIRSLGVYDSTDSWTYSTASWRQARGVTTNQVEVVVGLAEDAISVRAISYATSDGSSVAVSTGIGVDSTTVASGVINQMSVSSSFPNTGAAHVSGYVSAGKHYFAKLEYGAGAGTQTWYGDAGAPAIVQTGILGEFMA